MNLLIITDELRYSCGVTTHLINLTRGLAKQGNIKILLICGDGSGKERFSNIKIDIIIDKRFLHKNRNYSSYAAAVLSLRKIIKRNNIHLIHSHTHYGANIAAQAVRNLGITTIQTNHGILENRGRLSHFKANIYIAINNHIHEYIVNKNITKEENIRFIRCGIPVPPEPIKKHRKPIRVLAASRFIKEKGLDTSIRAVSLINEGSKKDIEFLIAGEGVLEDELRKLNDKLNAGIKFLGRVTDMDKFLESTQIFVFPSRSKTEGFPFVISEAGAHNNIVITSDFYGIKPYFVSNENCLMFHKDSEYELAKLIEIASSDYDNYKQLALKLYRKIRSDFDLNTMIQKHLDLYQECLQTLKK